MAVVVLRALGIGDLAAGVPALRGIRSAFPDQRIALAAPGWLAPLVTLTGAVDEMIPVYGLNGPLSMPAPKLAVNLHGKGPRSHQLLNRLRPKQLMAFRCPEAESPTGPVWLEQEHETARWCRMLHWYGIDTDPDDLALRLPAQPPPVPGATVIHPGAKAPHRRWPVERFAAVARELTADGHHVVITGAPADRRIAYLVARQAGLGPQQVYAGRTDIGELAAMVAAARLVICGDTGIAHLATGYGTPSVVLFGPLSPALWGPPPNRPRHRALWHPISSPEAATDRPHPALLAITAEQVLSAAKSVQTAVSLRAVITKRSEAISTRSEALVDM